jgi:hypothetical protein
MTFEKHLNSCYWKVIIMVILRTNEYGWNGTLIDGYVPEREKLEKLYLKYFRPCDLEPTPKPGNHSRDTLIYEVLEGKRGSFCSKIMRKYPSMVEKDRGKVKLKCECDLYIIGNENNRPIQGKASYLTEEFDFEGKIEDYRIVLLFDHECREPANCITQALEEVDFQIKKPDQYKDFEKFKEAGRILLVENLNFFNAPCMMVEKNLEDSGFSVLLS